MLGIPMEVLHQIAAQKTKHSWLAEVIQQVKDETQEENLEEQLAEWIMEEAEKMFPNNPMVERVVREALVITLEREAIQAFLQKNNQWADVMPTVESPEEGARVGAREAMADEADEEKAAILLRKMEHGELHPNL